MVDKVAKRYAVSFFRAVENLKDFQGISTQMEYLLKLIIENNQFNQFLKSPIITKEKKLKVFKELFEKRLNSVLYNFLTILILNNRENLLKGIILEFFNLKDIKDNILRIKIYSAIELKTKEKNYIIREIEKYTNKKIFADFYVDNDLIGGIVVMMKDRVLDGSVKRQLELMTLKLNENTLINVKYQE